MTSLGIAALVFFILLMMGMPITFVLGVTATLAFLLEQNLIFLSLIPQRMFAGLNLFTIMAIPFFLFAAELMSASKITDDLVDFADALVGRLKGGLAHVNVIASAFFAGISGSAISDVAGLGSIEIKAMTQAGYPKPFATALTVASSLIGPIIPPSIIMVLYGSIMQVSIAAMFLGGILPGIIMISILMTYITIIADKRGFPRRVEKLKPSEILRSGRNAVLALFLPVIILGGILSGIFTATEAAAVAVAYAFIVGFVIKQSIKVVDFFPILERVCVLTAVVFMVLATANILAWIIGLERLPEAISNWLISITRDPLLLFLLVNLLLIFIGMFMDIGAAVIVLAPILGPTMIEVGIHPVHFGIVMSINLLIGLTTPPVGPCLFVAAGITGLRMEVISKALLPFYLLQVLFLLLITYFPALTLSLPKYFGYI